MRFLTLLSGSIMFSFMFCTIAVAESSVPDRSPCSSYSGRDRARCESRYARRIQQGTQNRIIKARLTQDSSAFGRARLRAEERKRRSLINAESTSQRGPTVRMLPTTSDINTRRIQYLQEYRANQLQCMEVTHGRPRRLCFERIRNEVNKAMKEARGTWLKNRTLGN